MDGLTTLKELSRMCETTSCCKCGLMVYNNGLNLPCAKMLRTRPEEVYAVVEKWSKEHPVKTNADKFMEVFGVDPRSIGGTPYCPPLVDIGDCPNIKCVDCAKWWDKPYIEPDKE